MSEEGRRPGLVVEEKETRRRRRWRGRGCEEGSQARAGAVDPMKSCRAIFQNESDDERGIVVGEKR